MKLCFATNNPHKIEEVKAFLGDRYNIISLRELGFSGDLKEDYDTLERNAFQKASFVADQYHVDCFADDSGLEVETLNNEPGVKSARYAGEGRNDQENINLLLKNLKNNPDRKARFRTVISLCLNGKFYQFEGIVNGKIIDEKRGANGFGYDPIFIPDGFGHTFAEMDLATKNKISHRARAVEKLIDFLKKY